MDETLASLDDHHVESILAADIGSCWTRVALLDRVGGQYRFVARSELPTSSEPPVANVAVAVRLALEQIEISTGRVLLDARQALITPERADGSGVDFFVVTCSAARPLDVAIAGLIEQLSVANARRVARSTYSRIVDSFALDSGGGPWGSRHGAIGVVRRLYTSRPQVVVVAGGTDGGAVEPLIDLAEALGVAAEALPPAERPVVIFAGNTQAAEQVAAIVAEAVEYRRVENVLPAESRPQIDAVSAALGELFRDRRLARVPGLGAVKNWTRTPILPTADALTRVVRFLAHRANRRVLGVDVGAANTILVAAAGTQAAQTLIRTDLGMGSGLEGVLAQTTALDLCGWVPSGCDNMAAGGSAAAALLDALATHQLRPWGRPQSPRMLMFLQAAAREILRLTLAEAGAAFAADGLTAPAQGVLPPFDSILLGGAVLSEAPNPAQAVMIVLDGLQPTGISHLLLDRVGLVPAIGVLAEVAPAVAVDLLSGPVLESLGTVVAPVGVARRGAEVLNFRMTLPDGSGYEVNVEYGRVYREWLPPGQTIRLALRPARGFDIGFGPGKAAEISVTGGSVGLIIDARGRPLPLEDDLSARSARSAQWRSEIGA